MRNRKANPSLVRLLQISLGVTLWIAFAVWGSGSVLSAEDNQNLELGEISFFNNEVEVNHVFGSGDDRVQIGSKVYAGDTVKTGKNSVVEITFGINVRLRLEGSGEMVLQEPAETHKTVDEVRTTTKTFTVLLRHGTLRARVHENCVTATPVILKAGEARFFLPRSDFLLRRAPGDPAPKKMLDCLLAWGKVIIQLQSSSASKTPGKDASGNEFPNYQPGRTLVSEMPPDNTSPLWQPMTYGEARKLIQEKAPFSVDRAPNLPQDTPRDNPELRGA